MTTFMIRLKDLIWPAVLAAVGSVLAIVTALIAPDNGSLVLAFGLSAIAMACLAITL